MSLTGTKVEVELGPTTKADNDEKVALSRLLVCRDTNERLGVAVVASFARLLLGTISNREAQRTIAVLNLLDHD